MSKPEIKEFTLRELRTFMQTGALGVQHLLGRLNSFRTFVPEVQRMLSRLDLQYTFALRVECPNFGIWAFGRVGGKTDFLSCKVSKILRSSEYCLLSD
jgi:hypothetical protein